MKIKFLTVLSLAVVLFLGACGGKSDADLTKDANDALKANPNTTGLTANVKDAVATVSGEAKDATAQSTAKDLVGKVDGIKSVTDNSTLKPPPPTAKTDPALKETIEKALKDKGFNELTVDTSTTPATLKGIYPKGKLAEAMQTAQVANGGKPLKNEAAEAK